MQVDKDIFRFPKKFMPILETLTDEEFGIIIKAFIYKTPNNLSDKLKPFYKSFIQDVLNIEAKVEKWREWGKKWWRPKKNKETENTNNENHRVLENENHRVLEEEPKEKDKVKVKEKEKDKVNESENIPLPKNEKWEKKEIDNNPNLKNEYIMKMRDAETRWKFMIKKWNEKRADKKQFTMSDDLKKLIASFLDIWSIKEFETAIENFVFVIQNPYYNKRQSKYSLEHWDFQKFLENIGMFQDEKETYKKIIWTVWYRQTFRKKEEENLPEFKDRHEEMEYYRKKKEKEKKNYKWLTSQYWNPLKSI